MDCCTAHSSSVRDNALCLSQHGLAAVARAAAGTDRQTDRQTDTAPFNTLATYAQCVITVSDHRRRLESKVCVQLLTYADNVALPAFIGRTRCCCAPCSNPSISPAGQANSSRPAAAGFLLWPRAGTDRLTDGRTPDRYRRPCCA